MNRLKQRTPNAKIETVAVTGMTLNRILEENGVREVNYMSIDTEGSEYAILENFDFQKVKVDVLTVENNYGRDPIRELLEGKGFKFQIALEVSEVYRRG